VGYEKKSLKYKPFQEISQRIRRKYDIEKLSKDLPVEVNVFDILYFNGKDLLDKKFSERRKILEKIVKNEKWKLKVSDQIITDNEKKASDFYKKALKENQEGIMMKKLDAIYKPGSRVGYGVKIKPATEEFDLVIVKAEYGTGKRAGWLTSFTIACKHNDEFLEVGKVSTGLKEKEETGASFLQLTNLLKPFIIEEKAREIKLKPEIVVSVGYQEIQKSPSYSGGYALRFPRVVSIREDRTSEDITTLEEIEKAYFKQGFAKSSFVKLKGDKIK
jgi:DNA ligase 1